MQQRCQARTVGGRALVIVMSTGILNASSARASVKGRVLKPKRMLGMIVPIWESSGVYLRTFLTGCGCCTCGGMKHGCLVLCA